MDSESWLRPRRFRSRTPYCSSSLRNSQASGVPPSGAISFSRRDTGQSLSFEASELDSSEAVVRLAPDPPASPPGGATGPDRRPPVPPPGRSGIEEMEEGDGGDLTNASPTRNNSEGDRTSAAPLEFPSFAKAMARSRLFGGTRLDRKLSHQDRTSVKIPDRASASRPERTESATYSWARSLSSVRCIARNPERIVGTRDLPSLRPKLCAD